MCSSTTKAMNSKLSTRTVVGPLRNASRNHSVGGWTSARSRVWQASRTRPLTLAQPLARLTPPLRHRRRSQGTRVGQVAARAATAARTSSGRERRPCRSGGCQRRRRRLRACCPLFSEPDPCAREHRRSPGARPAALHGLAHSRAPLAGRAPEPPGRLVIVPAPAASAWQESTTLRQRRWAEQPPLPVTDLAPNV